MYAIVQNHAVAKGHLRCAEGHGQIDAREPGEKHPPQVGCLPGKVLVVGKTSAPPVRHIYQPPPSGTAEITMKKTQILLATLASVALVGIVTAQMGGTRPSWLQIGDLAVKRTNTATVSARLTSTNGQALAGYRVEFYAQYPSYSQQIGVAYTNNSGVASISFRPANYNINAGSYRWAAQFSGNGAWGASIPSAKLTVTN